MHHLELTFASYDNLQLFGQVWYPTGAPRASVIVIHGGFEHSGRYEHVAAYLTDRGFSVYACDLRGHGRSQGRRGYLKHFDDVLKDVDTFLGFFRKDSVGVPHFLFGHSAGGLVAVASMLFRKHTDMRGMVLSAPALKITNLTNPFVHTAIHLLARVVPKSKVPLIDARFLSHDPRVVAAYRQDPLIPKDGLCVSVLSELLYTMRRVNRRLSEISCPVLILHGTDDCLADTRGSKLLYENARSRDKTIRYYGGLYHEILNEPVKEQILREIVLWMERRIGLSFEAKKS